MQLRPKAFRSPLYHHPGDGGEPALVDPITVVHPAEKVHPRLSWVPTFAGMTDKKVMTVRGLVSRHEKAGRSFDASGFFD
jgi:hypothetical protein